MEDKHAASWIGVVGIFALMAGVVATFVYSATHKPSWVTVAMGLVMFGATVAFSRWFESHEGRTEDQGR